MVPPALSGLPPSLSLRDVEEADRSFLFDLYLETTGGAFAQLELPPAQLNELLEMQFRAREAGWRGAHPEGRFQIISVESNPAGYLACGELKGEITLIYLGLLKQYQGRGIASELLRSLQKKAAEKLRKICAHVEVGNPALGFWKHHKFKVLQDLGPYVSIEWQFEYGILAPYNH